MADIDNYGKMPMSNMYFNVNPIKEWVSEVPKELSEAKWVIVQKDDNHPTIRGYNYSSWQALQMNDSLFRQINSEFYKFRESSSFILFRKKQDFH
jgi:hypothetical protein